MVLFCLFVCFSFHGEKGVLVRSLSVSRRRLRLNCKEEEGWSEESILIFNFVDAAPFFFSFFVLFCDPHALFFFHIGVTSAHFSSEGED